MNNGYCSECDRLVPAMVQERENKMFLDKICPKCGPSSTLISSDARRYNLKHSFDEGSCDSGCGAHCEGCRSDKSPGIVFIEITNRCNMNCPICINNTPTMGFVYDPPIEYFERIIDYYANQSNPPYLQLFGGEPTVRQDLFQIIKYAKSRGLQTRVVTNGIRLADKEYCRKLLEYRPTIMFSYDGDDPETYKVHRANEKSMELKQQGLRNLAELGKAKVTVMTLVAKGYNDTKLADLLQFCHDNRSAVRSLYMMPLAHTWDSSIQIEAERITSEDLEIALDHCYPQDTIEFLPASFWGMIGNLIQCFRTSPLPFAGAHPNCESLYLFFSNGSEYVPISRYLKRSVFDLGKDLLKIEKRLVARLQADRSWARKIAKPMAMAATIPVILSNLRMSTFFKGEGLGKLSHAAKLLAKLALGRRVKDIFAEHANIASVFHVVVLPFEDKENMETERLDQCPSGFAYIDFKDDRVKHVPVCSWALHKDKIMNDVMEHYNLVKVLD